MAFIHPDMVLCIAAIAASLVLWRVYRINDSRNKINIVAPIGMSLFFVASVLNYIEETPLDFLMLAFYNEQEWDTIIPLFFYGPGGIMMSFAFFDWYRALNKLQDEVEHRKEVEEKLQQALIIANEASEAKSRFLASISHELRTPLNAILGFSDMITREQFGRVGNKKYIEYGDIIHRSGEHLLHIVDELLDLARVEEGKLALLEDSFAVEPLISECLDMVRYKARERDISIMTEIDCSEKLFADRRLVKQMLLNLLSNAIKYTELGGRIYVGFHSEEGEPTLYVDDTGIGMDEDDIKAALEAFAQGKNSFYRHNDGIGLGVPLVRRFIELHGGKLDIESIIGKGTKVLLSFPRERLVSP